MTPDKLTPALKDLLFDVEQVSAKLARLNGFAIASDPARDLALALAAAASAIARDATLLVVSLESSAAGLGHSRQIGTN